MVVDFVLHETDVATESGQLLGHSKQGALFREHGRVTIVELGDVPERRFQRVAGLLSHGESRRSGEARQFSPYSLPLKVVPQLETCLDSTFKSKQTQR